IVFMISQVGLTCLMVGYAIAGGFIFLYLEAGHAKEIRSFVGFNRLAHVKKVWDITSKLNILHEANWTRLADEIFEEFQQSVYVAVQNGWDGQDIFATKEIEEEWSFAGSLLYSVTVITTIGYGHLTPRTNWGRIVTIFYAIIGIPLTLLCLSNIGCLLAKLFRILWKHTQCKRCCKKENNEPGSVIENPINKPLVRGQGSRDVISDSAHYNNILENRRHSDIIRVPIPICLCLLALYIGLGALLFRLWERSWSYMDASYFCFVTLSTIGFGDLVPGYTHESWGNQYKRVACTLYLLFGLVVVAMCFDLIQTEV
ncbi:hypothetical protein LOTGIDRAFT_94184, partial [Lottia gigantea]